MIAQRHKANRNRSVATSRVKRDAVVNARRGLRTSAKVSKMEIEAAVQKHTNKEAIHDANQQMTTVTSQNKIPAGKVTPKQKGALKQKEREIQRVGQKAAQAENLTLPTRKQMQAARKALLEAGYTFPSNYILQVVPVPPKTKNENSKNNNNRNTSQQQQQQKQTSKKQSQQQQQQQQAGPKQDTQQSTGNKPAGKRGYRKN